ncbi:MAG: hypothetical protein AAF362_18075 [Pseudomonadota bacterium]
MQRKGSWLIAIGAFLGLAVSIYNFFSPVAFLAPLSSVSWSAGAGLVIFSTFVLMLAGLVLVSKVTNRALVIFLLTGSLIDVFGTAFAAYLLDSWVLMALMGLCLLGWLMRVFGSPEFGANHPAEAT